jgi:chromosome partitioning protein
MRNLLKVGLRRLVATPTQRYPVGDRHAAVVAVAARKGGVGKTTTAVSLASALARFHGKRVLLVDLDPQGHVGTALKSEVRPGGGPLSRVLQDEEGADVLDAITPTGIDGLDVTPLDPALAATEDLLGTRIGKEFILRDKLKITRTHYDVIVLDCPPNQGNLALNGLVAADQVLIPCDPSPLALTGVQSLVGTITTIAARLNPAIDVLGIVLTRVDGRNTTLNEAIVSQITDSWGDALLPVRVGIASSLAKAQQAGTDIFTFEPDGRAAQQYRALADHVAGAL